MRFLFFLCMFSSLFCQKIDVVIPVHEKDVHNLKFVINGAKERIENLRNIYVISEKKLSKRAIWIDEKKFPFTLQDVGEQLGEEGGVGNHPRRGWYYQQLLKLYAHKAIDGLTDHILILDGDTRPTHKMNFIEEHGRVYLDKCDIKCNNTFYYAHMKKLLPFLSEIDRSVNPIVHHMVFTKEIIEDLFYQVEQKHKISFWKVFLNKVKVYK